MQADVGLIEDTATLRREKRLHEQAFRLVNMGAWECDLETEQLTWTDGVYQLFDIEPGTPLQRCPILEMYFDESRRQMEAIRAEAIRLGRPFALDVRVRTAKDESRWVRITADVALEQGHPVRLFGAKQDITREREAWERLRRMAERDPLTGLANRGLFDAHYREVVSDEINHAFVSALVLIDLDRFKQVNDHLGHAAGDECLRQVAIRLQKAFPDAALIARLGGDEFAILLRAPLDAAGIAKSLRRAALALCRPLAWNGTHMDFGVSIGAAVLRQPPGFKLSNLFNHADAALYAAKAKGGNSVNVDGSTSTFKLSPIGHARIDRPPLTRRRSLP